MAVPFYTVYIKNSNRNITDLIDGFRFEDSVDEDDMLVLTLKDKSPEIVDDKDFQEGVLLSFQFGFKDRQSGKRIAQIQDVEPSFGGLLNITIKAFDLGLLLKKDDRQDLWEEVKASDIVKKIAIRNGLKYNVDETIKKYESLPQGNRNDFEFLKYLAEIEQDGSFRFFLRNDVIHFTRINLSKSPIKTYRWKEPNGGLLSFKPKSKGSEKKGASKETVVTGVDPITGEVFEQKITNENSEDDVKLGDYPINYNSDAVRQNTASEQQSQEEKTGKNLVFPADNAEEAKNVANSKKKKSAMEDLSADAQIEGDPIINSDELITVSNVGKKYSGNWYIKKAVHMIRSGSPYLTDLTLGRNASKANESNNDAANNINNQTGPDDGTQEKNVEVFIYDQNSNRING